MNEDDYLRYLEWRRRSEREVRKRLLGPEVHEEERPSQNRETYPEHIINAFEKTRERLGFKVPQEPPKTWQQSVEEAMSQDDPIHHQRMIDAENAVRRRLRLSPKQPSDETA